LTIDGTGVVELKRVLVLFNYGRRVRRAA